MVDELIQRDAEDTGDARTGPGGVADRRAGRVRNLRLAGYPKPLDRLYAVMTGTLIVQVGLHAITFLCEAAGSSAVGPQVGVTPTVLRHLYLASFFVFALAIPLGCVTWFRWLDWSVKNRIVASDGRFTPSPASVVWAYFVPGLNLYKPLLDLQRLWRAESRFGGEAPLVLAAWWVLTLAHLVSMAAALLMASRALVATSSALGVLSNLLALLVLVVFWRVQTTGNGGTVPVAPNDELATDKGALA